MGQKFTWEGLKDALKVERQAITLENFEDFYAKLMLSSAKPKRSSQMRATGQSREIVLKDWQMYVLRAACRDHGVAVDPSLCDAVGIPSAEINYCLGSLITRGFVQGTKDMKGRNRRLYITALGRQVLSQAAS